MKKIILFTTIILAGILATAQWITQSPFPTSNTLMDVHFVNENIGWITGEKGTIIKTNDSGITWTNQESGSIQTLRCMSFLDLNNAWIVGDSGTILNTNDGGENWMDQSITDTVHLYSVFFIGQIGWAAGMTLSENGVIFYSIDGGNSWQLQHFEAGHGLRDIYFTSLSSGWAASSHGVIHTEDGGNTWQTQFNANYINLNSIHFLDSLNGWSVGNGLVLHTIDGGNSWVTDTMQVYGWTLTFNDVVFNDSLNGYIVGEGHYSTINSGIFRRTIDGGNTWFGQSIPCDPQAKGICFINENKGWIVGAYGNITYTEDSGDDWVRKSLFTNEMMISDIFFFDELNGLALGTIPYLYFGQMTAYLLYTTNGGEDWQIQSNFWDSFGKLHVINDNNFWINGGYFIHQTKDGGISWGWSQPFGNNITPDIFFTDVQHGWSTTYEIAHNWSKIYHTLDEGANWEVQCTRNGEYLKSIYFIDQNTGWVVGKSGDSGVIINTMDGGLTWTNQLYANNQSFIKAHFFDAGNGLAIGKNGSVFQTSNGGNNWDQINVGFDINFSDVFFLDLNNIWAIGCEGQNPQPVFEGLIYLSSDGGLTWTEQENGTSRRLRGIWFNNPNEGWIVGNYGTILHTENGGINEIPQVENSNFQLTNYPNPFNSNTTIEFSLQEKSFVSVSVYDLSGKLQAMVVSKNLVSGTHRIEWNAQGLPPGIYFLRLEINGISETRKLIKTQ